MTDPFTPGLLDRIPEPERVVVLRASRLGDFVCATPALRALRRRLPHSEITLIALEYLRDLAERCPSIDRYIAFPGWPGIAEQFFEPRKTAAFFAAVQEHRFDLAIQMHGSGVNANPFTLMLGARCTAGFVRPGDGAGPLDGALPLPDGHEIRRSLALTTFLGAPAHGDHPDLPLRALDLGAARTLLGDLSRPLIGVHPGAREANKRWPSLRFAHAARHAQEAAGGTIVILGDDEERERTAAVVDALDGACVDLSGRLSLAALGAVIGSLDVLLTNDSGPAHIAYALHIPSVTIFGGTDPTRWFPLHAGPHVALFHPMPCRPCETCPIEYECLRQIDVPPVSAAVLDRLAAGRAGTPGDASRAAQRPAAAIPR
ncbi:MAG TPA: glycosyltransferase family 9 protein [Chloroflexota bacterium]|nr:glycosyltransferase family 9 protein [Chloroflexota bacterium]